MEQKPSLRTRIQNVNPKGQPEISYSVRVSRSQTNKIRSLFLFVLTTTYSSGLGAEMLPVVVPNRLKRSKLPPHGQIKGGLSEVGTAKYTILVWLNTQPIEMNWNWNWNGPMEDTFWIYYVVINSEMGPHDHMALALRPSACQCHASRGPRSEVPLSHFSHYMRLPPNFVCCKRSELQSNLSPVIRVQVKSLNGHIIGSKIKVGFCFNQHATTALQKGVDYMISCKIADFIFFFFVFFWVPWRLFSLQYWNF